jgi:hypothetical protein
MNEKVTMLAGIVHQANAVYAEASNSFYEAMDRAINEHHYYNDDASEDARLRDREEYMDKYRGAIRQLMSYIGAGLELLGISSTVLRHAEQCRSAKNNLDACEIDHDTDSFWSTALVAQAHFLSILECAVGKNVILPIEEFETKLLEQILASTPKIMSGLPIPRTEKQVYDSVQRHLEVAFPSFQATPKFRRYHKHFMPEFGIGSVRIAIEYKLAKSQKSVKIRFDELAPDTYGYRSSGEFDKYYAVIYQLKPWITQSTMDAWFRDMRYPSNWKVFAVHH